MDITEGILALDFETASACDIKVGAWAYSEHESTRVLCAVFCYAEAGGARRYVEWQPGDELPVQVLDFIECGGLLLAHNVSMERSVWMNIMVPVFGWPEVEIEQWRDAQAQSAAMNLPFSLDGLGKALRLTSKKDKEGHALMLQMCKAIPDGFGGWTYPMSENRTARRRLLDYCRIDVDVTVAAYFKMRPLTVTEALVWRVDQRINQRGVFLDEVFAAKCARMAEARKETLALDAFAATFCELENSTSTPALKAWLIEKGVELPKVARKRKDGTVTSTASCDKIVIAKLLKDTELPNDVRVVLSNRVEANKATSLAKLDKIPSIVGRDGRLRNALRYGGAHTGRWTSHGLQLHNLPKNKLSSAASDLATLCCDVESIDALTMFETRPLEAMSSLLRSIIRAAPGKELIAADWSAIEARVVAWLAGQDDILQQFADGTDVYMYTAEGIGSDSRQLGKVCVLALGYGMGDVLFHEKAAEGGVPIGRAYARETKRSWRETNAMIVAFWGDLDFAARYVIETGDPTRVGYLRFRMRNKCLEIILPSGRTLHYWRPRIRTVEKKFQVFDDDGTIITKTSVVEEIQFFTSKRGGMVLEKTYGGKLAENVTQAVARDLLGESLPRLDGRSPYDVVIHVHDSVAAEVPAGEGDVREFCELMEQVPSWAPGLPLAVEGYRDVRFRG